MPPTRTRKSWVSALPGQIRALAGRGAVHWADLMRREEPGADRADAVRPGRDQGGEFLLELPPREMLEAKLHEAIRLARGQMDGLRDLQ